MYRDKVYLLEHKIARKNLQNSKQNQGIFRVVLFPDAAGAHGTHAASLFALTFWRRL